MMFSQLGSLDHLDTPTGSIHTSSFNGQPTVTLANYTASARFQKGVANIQIQLSRDGDTWKINGFRINSDVLLSPKPEFMAPVSEQWYGISAGSSSR